MKTAAEFRSTARETLHGKWKIAVLVGVVASLLGGIEGTSPDVRVNLDASGLHANFEIAGQTILSTAGGETAGIGALFVGGFTTVAIVSLILGILYFVLGSFIEVGYAGFNLNLVDQKESSLENLFAYYSHWKTTAVTKFLKSLYITLWTLLLIIPGIIASYSYAMTEFILAEHPEMTASEAIRKSKEMMQGRRFDLFTLEFTFLGWHILCICTLGVGYLWLTPYIHAARAAFYREVSGTEC